jgi:LPPG:FO 2-phospho-L-lactate transferase
LSKITHDLAASLGIRQAVFPMSETPVRTRVKTPSGELAFQDYFVRQRCAPRVTGFRFAGARRARVPDALARILDGPVQAAILCPSNPFVSIAPIFSVPAIRTWLRQRRFPVVAVSPIIGGAAVKGPAAKIMRELGLKSTALAVAQHYGRDVDAWVIDRQDARSAATIGRLGKRVCVTDTLMTHRRNSAALARALLGFVRGIKKSV